MDMAELVNYGVFCWVLGLGCFFATPFRAGRYWTWSGGRGGRGGFVTILYYHFMRGGEAKLWGITSLILVLTGGELVSLQK